MSAAPTPPFHTTGPPPRPVHPPPSFFFPTRRAPAQPSALPRASFFPFPPPSCRGSRYVWAGRCRRWGQTARVGVSRGRATGRPLAASTGMVAATVPTLRACCVARQGPCIGVSLRRGCTERGVCRQGRACWDGAPAHGHAPPAAAVTWRCAQWPRATPRACRLLGDQALVGWGHTRTADALAVHRARA